MDLQVEAVYIQGIFKLDQPLPLHDGQRVRLTIQTTGYPVQSSHVLLKWTRSVEDLEYLANDPDVLYGTDEPYSPPTTPTSTAFPV
jgi:predicted DNA-binding antitoxin AbrB/MazE fold protein